MAESVLDRIEGTTGRDRRDDETVGEYLRRVAEQAGVEGDLTERTVEEFNRAAFSPGATPDGAVVESFVEELSGIDGVGDSPGGGVSDASDGGVASETDQGDDVGPDGPDGPGAPAGNAGEASGRPGDRVDDADTPEAEPSPGADTPAPSPSGGNGSSQGAGTSTEGAIPEDPFSSVESGEGYAERIVGATKGRFDRVSEFASLVGRDYYYLGAVLAVGAYVFLYTLGQGTLSVLDEPVHAEVASNMLYHGDYLIPHGHWDALALGETRTYHPFLRKPPMTMWLQAAAMYAFGVTEFAARLPSATAAILTGVVLFLFGRDLRNRRVGLFAALLFFTTVGYYATAHGGRAATDDALHTFAGVTFVYLVWSISTRERTGPWAYSALGVVAAFAVMVKGFAAAVFVIAVAPLVVLSWRQFATRSLLRTVAIPVVVVVPWVLFAYASEGQLFLDQIYYEEVLNRATGRRVTHDGTLFGFMQYPYFRHLPMLFDPWSFYLLPAVGHLAVTLLPDRPSRDLVNFGVLGWWFGSILAFFVVTGNNSWYVMPIYPAGALLVAWMLDDAIEGRKPAMVAVVAGTVLTLLFSFRVAGVSPFALPDPDPVFGHQVTSGWYFAAVVVAGTALTLAPPLLGRQLTLPERTRDAAVTWAPVVLSVVFVVMLVLAPPSIGGVEEQEELGTHLGQEIDDEVLYVDPLVIEHSHLATAFYMGDVRIRRMPIEDIDANPDVRYALIDQEQHDRLSRPHEARYVSAPNDLAVIEFTG